MIQRQRGNCDVTTDGLDRTSTIFFAIASNIILFVSVSLEGMLLKRKLPI
jgi:hypothetical protein